MSLSMLPLDQIRLPKAAMRGANRKDPKFASLVDSVKRNGILNAILVRERSDGDGTKFFELVEGTQRYSAAQDAGLAAIPAQVKVLTDAEVEEVQIIGNLHRIETKGYEYSNQLLRLMARDSSLTIPRLAEKLSVSPVWLSERLNLTKLKPEYGKLVDEGKINVTNGVALSKLPQEEQQNYLERAQTLSPAEFTALATERKREIEKAKRAGRDPNAAEFTPHAHLQNIKNIKEELGTPKIGPALLRNHGVTAIDDAWTMALKWVLHLDPESVEAARKADAEHRAKQAETRQKAAEERARKKAEAAAAVAQRVTAEVAG